MTKRVYNFYAGPATLPLPALKKAQENLLNFANTGMSVMEISHRTIEWQNEIDEAENLVRDLMNVPNDYKVLWLGGGASTQFLMTAINLQVKGKPMEYVNTGGWATKAIKEAKLYGEVNVVASSEEDKFRYIPKDFAISDNAAFLHITSNNTLYGTEWHDWPSPPEDVPLVVDMSSDLMARPVDVKDFGVIYAGAQKNLGPSGVTLVIVREDLLDRVPDATPTMLKWSTHAGKGSMFNTPPVFPIYMCKLAMEYWKDFGGVAEIEKINREKAKILYDIIDASDGFYNGHAREDSRSLMNVTFTMANDEIETKCVAEGTLRDLVGLKG
ncbi:MAG: 3-phosphoserine/phosphohydroxythreonine transaminase, partial [Candidatus Thorarchaeota archaeon]